MRQNYKDNTDKILQILVLMEKIMKQYIYYRKKNTNNINNAEQTHQSPTMGIWIKGNWGCISELFSCEVLSPCCGLLTLSAIKVQAGELCVSATFSDRITWAKFQLYTLFIKKKN